jgi:hypothetical protein
MGLGTQIRVPKVIFFHVPSHVILIFSESFVFQAAHKDSLYKIKGLSCLSSGLRSYCRELAAAPRHGCGLWKLAAAPNNPKRQRNFAA